jgi:hypothetical protein
MSHIIGPALGVLIAIVIAGVALFPIAGIGLLLRLNAHGAFGPFVLACDLVVFVLALRCQFRRIPTAK